MMTMSGEFRLWDFALAISKLDQKKKRSNIRRCRPLLKSEIPGSSYYYSRLDQAEVTILPFKEHAQAICVGVAKHHEVIGARSEIKRGFFGRHRFHSVPACANDSRGRRRGLEMSVRFRGHI